MKNNQITVYKMFRLEEDGLHYLYVNTKSEGIHEGDTVKARDGGYQIDPKNGRKYVSSADADGSIKRLAYRPGLHCASLPLNAHIGSKGADGKLYRRRNTVFAECVITGKDYISECIERSIETSGKIIPRECMLEHLPAGGYYKYQTNTNANKDQQWYITDQIIIKRILPEEEVNAICRAAGFEPQPFEA